MPEAPETAEDRRVRVAVLSDQLLVAEAVAAALTGCGLDAVPREAELSSGPSGSGLDVVAPDVAVLLYDLDVSLRLARARALVRSWPGPWLVLTRAPPGPARGGLLSAGARDVLPHDVDLATVERRVRGLAAGEATADPAQVVQQVAAWRELQARHGDLQRRIARLAPRELDVLELLCRGVLVVEIARRRGLAETTVRTQVRAVLRKLGVRSQLAAVALVRGAEEAARPGEGETTAPV